MSNTIDLIISSLVGHRAIRDGFIDIPIHKISNKVHQRVLENPKVFEFDMSSQSNHLVLSFVVGEMGLKYKWMCSFLLRAAELNKYGDRSVVFEAAPTARFGAANWAAKLTRFSLTLIPGVGPLLSIILRSILDYVAQELVEEQIEESVSGMGIIQEDNLWRIELQEELLRTHPLFREHTIPGVGRLSVLGGIVVARKVTLHQNTIRINLELRKEVIEAVKIVQESMLALVPDVSLPSVSLPKRKETSISERTENISDSFSKIVGNIKSKPPSLSDVVEQGTKRSSGLFSKLKKLSKDQIMETVEQSIIDTKSTISQSVEDTGEKLTVIESSVAELRQVVSESSGSEYEGINM